MSRNSINYLGFDSLQPIDKKFIKIEFLRKKFRSITTNNLLNGVKNLKDSDPKFKEWLDEKQRKQRSKVSSRVVPVILAKGRGITKRKKKRKRKSKKKRVRKGGKTRRRS